MKCLIMGTRSINCWIEQAYWELTSRLGNLAESTTAQTNQSKPLSQPDTKMRQGQIGVDGDSVVVGLDLSHHCFVP